MLTNDETSKCLTFSRKTISCFSFYKTHNDCKMYCKEKTSAKNKMKLFPKAFRPNCNGKPEKTLVVHFSYQMYFFATINQFCC